jgi:hypothetical protein
MMAGGGSAAARQTFETTIVTEAEVRAWMRTATPGDSLVYCTGPAMLPGPTQDALKRLICEGRVRTHKRRNGERLEHFLVVLPNQETVTATASKGPDEASERIFEALEQCVRLGRRAPSDQELAKLAGLGSRNQAAWRVRKLAEAGRIHIDTVEAADRTAWRIVTIGRASSLRPTLRAIVK